MVVFTHVMSYDVDWDRLGTSGRPPRTRETLSDFRESCRVTRHSRVFRRLAGCQRTLGNGASQLGIRAKVNDYLGSSVGVSISIVLIPASQLGIKAKVNDYLGGSMGVFISLVLISASQLGIRA